VTHHHPAPSDAYVIDWDEAAPRLALAATADAEWYASVATQLVTPRDRLAVDVGCGGAGMAAALASAMNGATPAVVLAVDGDTSVLDTARNHLPAGLEASVQFVLDDLGTDLPATRAAMTEHQATEGADIVWASASVHHAGDQQSAITVLARLLAPGGRLALAEGGLPLRCLPWDVGVGEPGLETRLDAAQDRWFAQMRRQLPGSVPLPYGWTAALRNAGLPHTRTVSWLFESPTPLPEPDRERVVRELAHRVDRVRETELLAADDLHAWTRLLDQGDPAWLGHRQDLQRLTVRSVHIGQQAAG
jgi:SAM-dependent methyltransferase